MEGLFLRLCVRAVREGGSHPDRFFCKGLGMVCGGVFGSEKRGRKEGEGVRR